MGAVVPAVFAGWVACGRETTSLSVSSSSDASTVADAKHTQRDGGNVPDASEMKDAEDAGRWAHLKGIWDPILNAPPICNSRIARNPGTDVPKLAWRACAARPNCQIAPSDWSQFPGSTYIHQPMELVRADATGKPHLFSRRGYPVGPYRYSGEMLSVIQTLDDQIEFALDTFPAMNACGHQFAMHETGITHMMTINQASLRFQTAPWSNLNAMTERTMISNAALDATGSSGTFASNNSEAFVGVAGPFRTVVVDFATGTAHEPPGKPYIVFERQVPDGALVSDQGYDGAVSLLKSAGTLSRLATPPVGMSIPIYGIDRARGHSIVWIESETVAPAERAAVYVSPYATSAASIVRRRVTAIEDQTIFSPTLIVNAGYALIGFRDEHLLLLRLSDGMGWTIDSEPGRLIKEALWVDDTEVWAMTGTLQGTGVYSDALMRIKLTSLGSPTVMPR